MENSKALPLILSITALITSAGALTVTLTRCCDGNKDAAPPPASPAAVSQVFGQSLESGYSRAVRYGGLVWTAGHLPQALPPGADIERQTEAVMENLKRTLEEAGAGLDTTVMTNVYLADFDDWDAFNRIYVRYFVGRVPPRATLQIGRLGSGKIEISMVAHVRAER